MNDFPSLESQNNKSKLEEQNQFPQNCQFMKYLQPSSEAIHNEQQPVDEYEDIYKTLSSGVYESSDAYQPEEQSEGDPHTFHQQHQSDRIIIDKKVDFHSSVIEKPILHANAVKNEQQNVCYTQIDDQAQKQYQKVQTVTQSARTNYIQSKQKEQMEPTTSKVQKEQQEERNEEYPSLEYQQKNANQQQINQQEQAQLMDNDSLQQKPLQSSINICVQESITLPEQEQHLKQEKKVDQKAFQTQQVVEKPKFVRPLVAVAPKLQFKSIEVSLQKFANHEQYEGTKINITGYEQQYFLKIQTQIFRIDVHRREKQYVIKRRFSEFATLQKLIRHHYPGYILYPFPQKNIEFFKKLKLSIGSEQQKIIIIEKRLLQLEKYLNFLLSHRQISSSIILQIFLEESTDTFQKEINNLLSISLEQEKELQLGVIEENYNSFKKLMKSGLSFFNNYLASSSTDSDLEANLKILQENSKKNNDILKTIEVQLEQCTQKFSNFSTNIQRLAAIHKQNSQISNIDSNIDSVLKLSSKISSSRSFSQKYSQWIEDNLIYHIRYYDLLFKTIRQSIAFRMQLVSKIDGLTIEHYEVAEKIEEKIQLFDQRFVKDWSNIMRQLDHNLAILYQKFNSEWKIHCRLMSKIWK